MSFLEENKAKELDYLKPDQKFGVRHYQACLLFTCAIIAGMLSVTTNIALLAMTDQNTTINVTVYDWDKRIHGYIQSSYFWGEISVQILACSFVHKCGAKNFVTIGLIVTGAIGIMKPLLADWGGWMGMCFGTMLQSFCNGLIIPAMHTLIGKWAPPTERTRIGNFIYAGYYVSTIVAFPMYAFIGTCELGWPWIFYSNGAKSIACGLLWMTYGSNSPAEHRSISEIEKIYIEKSLEQTENQKISKTPWKKIFTSIPFLALIVAHTGAIWSYTVMFYEITSYYSEGLGVQLHNSGLLSSLGYSSALVFVFASSWIVDKAINKGYPTTVVRLTANTMGTWCPALCLIIILFVPSEYPQIKIYITIAIIGLDGINNCGYWVNHIDLSPNYGGVLMAIATFISDLLALLAPVVCGYILEDPHDENQWNKVFLLTAIVYFVSNLIFIIFGNAEKQSWDNPNADDKDVDAVEMEKRPLSN